MTRLAPRQMFATMKSTTPSCQLLPVMRNISDAAAAPVQANAPKRRVGAGERSAMAPTKMRKIAEMIVEKVAV